MGCVIKVITFKVTSLLIELKYSFTVFEKIELDVANCLPFDMTHGSAQNMLVLA